MVEKSGIFTRANKDVLEVDLESVQCVNKVLRIPHIVQGVSQLWFQ
jgi:hypothetical protein